MVRPLSVNDVMSVPIVAIASLTRKIFAGPRLARSAMAMVAGSTWMPSAISPADSEPVSIAAPASPGSRLPIWLIALNRCVTMVAPA